MPETERSTCIFCDNPLDGSDEHIIPDSVNGRLHSKTLICASCNQKFGSRLDPVIKEALHFVLFALGVGNVKKMKVTDQAGKAFTVDQAGKMKEVAPEIEVIKREDGKIALQVDGDKNLVPQAFAKKATRLFGKNALKLLDQKAIHVEEKVHFLAEVKGETAVEITPKLKLALNKILTEFYAFSDLPLAPLKPRLDRIFALDESGDDMEICNFDLEVRQPEEAVVSHLIVIRSDPEKKQLIGYVEIFNIICGHTVFMNAYEGPEIDISYQQNAITGKKIDSPVSLNLGAVGATEEKFDKLINKAFENARSSDQLTRFNAILEDIKVQLGAELEAKKITAAEHDEKLLNAGIQLAAEMMVYDFPDDVDDFTEEEEKMVNYIHSIIKESGKEEFELCYQKLVGREYSFQEDRMTYVMESFNYKRHPPKKGESRFQVYGYFRAKDGSKEKYILVRDIFDSLKLTPPPPDASWL
ncbi:HNH endonuclease [Mucilaginibacter rubeus]|uniref:HNH endonuclease n=1 Tax=Mucilaginibacter rubeus TaxID=2027860 RepID=A0AAE6JKV9_9SPHI|nr:MULTISPECIES: HNH endonuclease [Mucilaginibacter]QEM06437.1 HNH endonuclease [Mucilaginibacter rubeus]QEM19021.1 HNH endonuclease [Mucilaginibacter gossypii]QTE44436.1 HNH endonuclease [Mucilaginibacter rubeus]QTE51035.1 HNH endonuclease [Mucilaginibacter rubeus]QTE56118.1 HNH endonuclease [Mucilaginibacter rubeus]